MYTAISAPMIKKLPQKSCGIIFLCLRHAHFHLGILAYSSWAGRRTV